MNTTENTNWEVEFDRVFVTENLWKSDDEFTANVPIDNIKKFITSRLTLQRKEMREMVEKMKVPEGDLMELTGAKMNENSIRHLVRTSCDMRQNVVLEDIINALGE